jgi:uncharacterized protein YdhG (YjbR/CyaY superfamily)
MTRFKSIDDYIAAQPQDVAARLTQLRKLFHTLVPGVEETISYDIPAFKFGKERLYISGFKQHIGMYPMYGLPELEVDMAAYRGKGTTDSLHFKHAAPLPLELIEKIIKAKLLK